MSCPSGPAAPTPDRAPRGLRPCRAYLPVLAAALALYVVSMAPGVLWQDSALAQVRVVRRDLVGDLGLALSHPLYYVLAVAFQALPLGEPAFKTNLVSAVCGALTVANVFLLLRLLTGRGDAALLGALALAVAHTFWQHCALAEVYTVSTALLSGELLCLHRYAATGRPRWLLLLCGLNGLGVSNHLLATLSLACYGTLLLVLLIRKRLSWRIAPLLAASWLAGAALYLGLLVGQWAGGQPLPDVLHSALFGQAHYVAGVLNPFPSARQLARSVLYLALNFPTPAALLAVAGLVRLARRRRDTFAWTFVGLLALHLYWAVRYDVPDQYTFFILPVLLLALLMGLGAADLFGRRSAAWRRPAFILVLLPVAVYAALPAAARAARLTLDLKRSVPYRDELSYFLRPWKTGYRGAERFARELAESLPPHAVLFADSTTANPLHYLRLTGRWRQDVTVFPAAEKPSDPLNIPTPVRQREAISAGCAFVVTPQLPYCPAWLLEGDYAFAPVGPVYQVRLVAGSASAPASESAVDAADQP